ncbi:MAG: MFS transporter [Alphaproteobacteria bacterium]|nr:MFS transporter [Alphaproteobacteria bacterium]
MDRSKAHRWLYFFSLVLAAESIYMLPYLRKTFQTSMEEAFGLGAVDLGLLNTMFGIIALLAYFPGGWLADRVSARKLLSFSLFSTGLGGLYMATIPSHMGLTILHAVWGCTSVLTFWAALIKAVRCWGGQDQQGTGFGLLEAGRGVIAAVLASLATLTFAYGGTTTGGLVSVILFYSSATFLAGALVWFLVPDTLYENPANDGPATGNSSQTPAAHDAEPAHWSSILKTRHNWYLAAIIFSAYTLFLGTYDFPAYAERGFVQTKLFGAQLATFRDWLRPIAAIAAGLIADRFHATNVISIAFVALLAIYLSLAVLPAGPALLWLFWGQVAIAAIAVFALRAVYFALLEESNVPVSQTGMTVGFISVIGYAPDLFSHALAGLFVDGFGVSLGYRYYFGFLTVIAGIGLFATIQIIRERHRT